MKLSHHSREEGGALILVLLLSLMLSLLGLALLMTSETEMILGGTERVITSTFYAAESGTNVAAARIMTGAVAPTTFVLAESPEDANFRIGYQVGLTRSIAVAQGPCNFCSANEDGESWSKKVTYLVTARATRRDWRSVDPDNPAPPDESTIQAQKSISLTYEFQPTEAPRIDSIPTAEEALRVSL